MYSFRRALYLSDIKSRYRPKQWEPEKALITRLTLHARSVSFVLPESQTPLTIEAPLPKDFELVLKMLRKYGRR